MRYAILFSGMTERRNLNGLEFCYRTLIDRFGFEGDHIHVLTYDGSLRTADESPGNDPESRFWPGDATPHRMKVNGEGSREAFARVLDSLRCKLTEDDLLFINTVGHGGDYADGRGPFLIAYPCRVRYRMHDFCNDLATLPPHRSLLVLMAQCFSSGFNQAVLDASPAERTFIASASSRYSYAMREDRNWDSFERNWIAALSGRDVDGTPLQWEPARRNNNRVSVREAFNYASAPHVRDPRDTPECAASPQIAEHMTLDAA